MKKKKLIIVCIFLTLIALTTIYTVVAAVKSYQYDMDPANGVDIFEGFGAVYIMMIGGFVVFCELDLFYTVYYFFIKSKTVVKSILNILSHLTLLVVFFTDHIIDFGRKYLPSIFETTLEEGIIPIGLFFTYIVLRVVYFIVSTRDLAQEQ